MKTRQQIIDMSEEERIEYQVRMQTAFERVEPKTHWKDKINKILPADTSQQELNDIAEAIDYYTATQATFTSLKDGRTRVTAAGYWGGPAV
jgi:hypothetical protein